MDKFMIGGKEHDAVITYRVLRYFSENCKKEKLEAMSFEESEDIVLNAVLMCLVNKAEFKDRDALMDVMTNDEFKVLNTRFGNILNPDVEGKTEIEKKPA
jgi:hypothetical protein